MSGRNSREATCRQAATALVLALLLASCSQKPAGIVPVSGRVTRHGQPVAGAVVTFQPTLESGPGRSSGMGSSGRTDEAGRFTLTLIEPAVPGALVGQHVVTITTATSSGGDAARPAGELAPKRWRDGSQTFEVPTGGTTAADFELEPEPERPAGGAP